MKRPPPFRELDFSFLIPSVDHIELFAASLGSSILSVLGINTLFPEWVLSLSGFSFCEFMGLRMFPSLECFPRVGELGPELEAEFLTEDCGDMHGIFQEADTAQPQYAGVG